MNHSYLIESAKVKSATQNYIFAKDAKGGALVAYHQSLIKQTDYFKNYHTIKQGKIPVKNILGTKFMLREGQSDKDKTLLFIHATEALSFFEKENLSEQNEKDLTIDFWLDVKYKLTKFVSKVLSQNNDDSDIILVIFTIGYERLGTNIADVLLSDEDIQNKIINDIHEYDDFDIKIQVIKNALYSNQEIRKAIVRGQLMIMPYILGIKELTNSKM